MSWFSFALISVLAIAIANIYQRLSMRHESANPWANAITFQFLLAFFSAIPLAKTGFSWPVSSELWPFFGLSALLYAIGTIAFFQAAKKIEASTITILSAIGAIVTILAALLFLGESLNLSQLVGVALVLGGVWISQPKSIPQKDLQGIWFAILGTSAYGLAVVSDTHILRTYDALSYTPIMSVLPGLLLIICRPRAITGVFALVTSAHFKQSLLYAAFYAIQAITYYQALTHGAQSSQLTVVFRAEILLTILLAAILLRERERLGIKVLAAIIVAGGVLLLK